MKEQTYRRLFFTLVLLTASTVAFSSERPIGFAALDGQGSQYLAGGTTGGAGGTVVTVTTLADLKYYAGQTAKYIIQIAGPIVSPTPGTVTVKSNKTLLGIGNNAALVNHGLNLSDVSNIIIKNLTVRDYYMMGDYDGKLNDYDAIALRNAHHVWIDHCHLSRAGDGLLDMTYTSGYVTVSWTIFSHHNKTVIANGPSSGSPLGTYTFHHCWFNNTTQRNVTAEWADVHAFNCWLLGLRSYGMLPRSQSRMRLENLYFQQGKDAYYETSGGLVAAVGCILDSMTGLAVASGNDFLPPYPYVLNRAADVPALVKAKAGPGGFDKWMGTPVIQINFRPAGASDVKGMLSDTGAGFANRGNGYTYGWNADNTANAFWRQTRTTKEGETYLVPVDADFRRNAFLTTASGSRFWEITLPNGWYHVTLMCGDPGDPRNIFPENNIPRLNNVLLEGVLLEDPDGAVLWDYDEYQTVVQVSDGRLTIAQAPGSSYSAALGFVEIRPAIAPVSAVSRGPGLTCRIYPGSGSFLPDFESMSPAAKGAVHDFNLSSLPVPPPFGAVLEGYLNVPEDGWYTFYVSSSDGSRLFINSIEVVDNDGIHGPQEVAGSILLQTGLHPIRVESFTRSTPNLTVSWSGPSFTKRPLDADRLTRDWLYGDFTGNGRVDLEDLSCLAEQWLHEAGWEMDSGRIDLTVFARMAQNWLAETP